MGKVSTSERLKEIMKKKSMKQVDILRMVEPYCKKYNVLFGKSALSQYISGKVEPKQNKLFVLAKALNVNESWLMGYDVPSDVVYNNAEKKEDYEIIGERIKNRRIQLNLTQKQLAEKVGNISEYKINEIENGSSCEGEFRGLAFAYALDVDIDYIYGLEYTEKELEELKENELLQLYRLLNDLGKEKAQEYITDLSEQEKYTK